MARKHRIQSDWNTAGQTDLSTVGVPAEKQAKIGVRGLLISSLAARALSENCQAGGGDGTVNAVAGILAGTDAAIGVLPMGTLNHFAKELAFLGVSKLLSVTSSPAKSRMWMSAK
jgi:hypothetical protein